MSETAVHLSPRRWLPWIAPGVVLALAVLLWYWQIDRNGWCVSQIRDGEEIRVGYTPAAKWGLPLLSLLAVAAAAVAARKMFVLKLDRRHPGIMTAFCVAFTMALYWLVEINGVWADSLHLGPEGLHSEQTRWMVHQSNTIEYGKIKDVWAGEEKWIIVMRDGTRHELRPTPLFHGLYGELLSRVQRPGQGTRTSPP